MTLHDLDQLPLLLRRKDVIRLTNWTDAVIAAYVAEGSLVPVRPAGRRKALWRKYEVMKLIGVQFDSQGKVIACTK